MNPSPNLDLALDLAKKAGVVIRKNFTHGMEEEWKGNHTPVTETDLAVNAMVLAAVKEAFPDHSILSEEGDDFSDESEYVWICDPVDGTHNFSHGIPTATFALALTHKGQPVLGVIYDPFLDRMFSAEKGGGAHLNGKPIHVSPTTTLKHTLVGMGKMKGVVDLFPIMEHVYDHGTKIISGLSTHYLNALVAAGEFSASVFAGTSAHDMTASKIIVEEAGGTATDIHGKYAERYDRDMEGQICSNGILHEELLALIK